ncbi:hypothetical protein L1987_03301 [Smallanthus sonchifolius]|uniref:Uncharacterized protein n=1 Tax=Smallanthus sonchifolius TaxID=185202 RepID=A0ACB9KA91_9ASTR|nr:hypothetical protein L1987_03301 [Smallanthus sonchifolius]
MRGPSGTIVWNRNEIEGPTGTVVCNRNGNLEYPDLKQNPDLEFQKPATPVKPPSPADHTCRKPATLTKPPSPADQTTKPISD